MHPIHSQNNSKLTYDGFNEEIAKMLLDFEKINCELAF